MQSTLMVTIVETLRYRGFWGQWSWLAHRLSGLAVLLFLIIHVWDTVNAAFWPEAYQERLDVLEQRYGVWRCRTIFNCTNACPRDIEVTKAIAEVKKSLSTGTV